MVRIHPPQEAGHYINWHWKVAATGAAIAERVRNELLSHGNRCWRKCVGCVGNARREEANGEQHGGEKAGEEAENPHEGASEDLVLKRCDAKHGRGLKIVRINHAVGEGEEGGQGAAGEHAEEEIKRNAPAGPARLGRKGLNDRPPEEGGGEQKTEVFDVVPAVGTQSEIEEGWNVPGDEGECGNNPTGERMR